MKNKKVARTLTAIALTAAMAAPITASAAGTIPADGTVKGEDVSKEQTATTSVVLDAQAMYIVTIPATIELKEVDGSAIYSGSGEITANSVHLNEGKKLEVTLQSDFQLDAQNNALAYEAATDANFDQKIQTGGVVGHFVASTGAAADVPLSIYFKTTQALTYAGTYKDTVTFSFKEVPIQ